jgi:hypothetical protein
MPLRRLSALVLAAMGVEPAVVAFPNPYARFEVGKDAQDGLRVASPQALELRTRYRVNAYW